MAKRSRKLNVDKFVKEGRGQGVGSEYKPWIRIQDVPSKGRSTRVRGLKTQRQHEFLSDMERNYFYYLEYSDKVNDIREQFPLLPLEDTILIAEELGYVHPKHPFTGENIALTTDFLITVEENGKLSTIARTIKAKDDLLDRRVIEKFEIERVYWQRREVDWAIVTETEIDKTVAKNISYFLSYYNIGSLDAFNNISDEEIQDLIMEFLKRIIDTENTIREIASIFDKDMSLPKGTGISIFKHLLARKVIVADLTGTFSIDRRIEVKMREKVLNKELNIS